MKKDVFKICTRTAWLCLEGGMILLLLLFAAAGVLIWKMSQGPLDLAFAKDTIETALRDEERGIYIGLDSAQLYWPDRRGPVLIGLRGVEVARAGREGSTISIDEIDLDLSYRALVFGQVRPTGLILRRPNISLIRQNGDIDLFVGTQQIGEQDDEVDTADDIRARIIQVVEGLSDPSTRDAGFLDRLERLRIVDARAVLRDLDQGLTWNLTDLDFGILNTRREVAMDLAIGQAGEGMSFNAAYRKGEQDYTLNANLTDFNPFILTRLARDVIGDITLDLPVNGTVIAGFDKMLKLEKMNAALNADEGIVEYPDQFEAPVKVSGFGFKLDYNDARKAGTLRDFKIALNDVPLTGEGDFTIDENGQMTAPVTLHGTEIPQEAIGPLFPKIERDGDAAEWLIDKMSGGVFTDVKATSTLLAGPDEEGNWSFNTSKSRIEFAFDGVDVDYAPPLMPAKNTKGSGFFDFDTERLEVDGERAEIGDVISNKSKLIFTEIMVSGGGFADITFEASGPLKTALAYVSGEPVNMGETLGFDTKAAEGNIEMTTNLKFPTKKDLPKEEMIVKIDATLNDVLIPGVVEGLDLTGGPYDLKVADGAYSVKGSGKLQGRDVTLDWMQYFDSAGKEFDSKVTAQITSDEGLRDHFGIELKEYISGPLPVDLTYTEKPNGNAVIDVKGNLNPLTIHINPFHYKKPPGVNGSVRLQAHLEKSILKEVRDVHLNTTGFALENARLLFRPMRGKDAELSKGTVQKGSIGKSAAKVDFEITPQNILKVQARGALVDASPFMDPPEELPPAPPGSAQRMHIAVDAQQMITKSDRRVQNVKLYLETDTDAEITHLEVDAKAGQGDIYIRFKPDAAGKRTFRLEADDAGAALYAADMYDNAKGGTLLVYGEPKGANMKGNLFGVARMENFTVVKAPALAQLLNAMSLGGLMQQLQGQQGLPFEKLEADFEWRFRDGGNLLLIEDGRTSGSSIGLTFEGTIDQQKNQTNIGGTIVPMSGINNLIGSIPLIGDILTGGGALIAATYTFRGPIKEPRVAVNPLSVLTPGIIRRILFEGGYDADVPQRQDNNPDR